MKTPQFSHLLYTVALSLLFSVMSAARAQNFAVNWYTIDGGGGVSTGGLFTVRGTIGQPDAGRMGDGYFSVSGGFWGLFAIQTTGAPLLSVEKLSDGSARIYWPLPGTGFLLDHTANLSNAAPATVWSQVAFPYQTNATHISITVPMPSGKQFYRLRKQ